MQELIRPMRVDDYCSLVALWSQFPGNTMTAADYARSFERFLGRNGSHCFCATEDEEVIGSVMAGNDGRRGYVYHLAVDRTHQGGGLGRRLMEAVEESLKSKGVEKVHLFIYRDNPAVEFYQRIGWHRREDIEVMSKVLIGSEFMGTRLDEGEVGRE